MQNGINYQKIEPALASALQSLEYPEESELAIFIRTTESPEVNVLQILQDLGIYDMKRRGRWFTATVTAKAIEQLSQLPWVQSLSLSRELHLTSPTPTMANF